MVIDSSKIEELLANAALSERRRCNYDLRTTPTESCQRMLNAIMPGSEIPMHRHKDTAETIVIVKGEADIIEIDDNATIQKRCRVGSSTGNLIFQVPPGVWHTLVAITPCVIAEFRNGHYTPLQDDDIMQWK